VTDDHRSLWSSRSRIGDRSPIPPGRLGQVMQPVAAQSFQFRCFWRAWSGGHSSTSRTRFSKYTCHRFGSVVWPRKALSASMRGSCVRRVANTLPLGPWDLPLMRRCEILSAGGGRRLATFRQVDALLDGRSAPEDFCPTIDEVQRTFVGGDASFVHCATCERIPWRAVTR